MTLVRSVASAKGLTETASAEHVVVFRTVGTQRYAALYNLRAIREGVYADPVIYPNDVLVIGESAARRTFRDVIQSAPLLLAPVVALLQGGSL
jgi:polysaccharide biosynthesis/export protein